MAMVMPRSFSSGALSMASNGVKSASPRSASTFVMAAVSVVLPWSMWPIVPMFTCGLFRSNFCFDIASSSLLTTRRLAAHRRDDLFLDRLRHFLVRVELHRVRSAALSTAAELGRVSEHLCQRHLRLHDAVTAALVHGLDATASTRQVADHIAHVLLGRDDLYVEDRLEQHRLGPARALLEGHRARDLEGHLGRVDLVIRAVGERHPNVHHRVTGEHAGR